MPGGDGTGPGGMGSMTGRAAGHCAGYAVPGFMNPIAGRGFWGWGRGGGGTPYGAPYVAPFAPTVSAEQELDQLKGQAEYFEDALDGIKKRIEELEAQSKDE